METPPLNTAIAASRLRRLNAGSAARLLAYVIAVCGFAGKAGNAPVCLELLKRNADVPLAGVEDSVQLSLKHGAEAGHACTVGKAFRTHT